MLEKEPSLDPMHGDFDENFEYQAPQDFLKNKSMKKNMMRKVIKHMKNMFMKSLIIPYMNILMRNLKIKHSRFPLKA
jgi:hypothetical protein